MNDRNDSPAAVKALCFDVFGTVVDWRGSVIRECQALSATKGLQVDCEGFADAWRAGYQPAMLPVRENVREYVHLDVLHREILDGLLPRFGLSGLNEEERRHLNRVWHRLDGWPDAAEGMRRLRERFLLAALSNGHVALIVNMARHAGLPWDAPLGAEMARQYKPRAEVYDNTIRMLGLLPQETMMVAAHNDDLRAARGRGMRTAFVARPTEYGPRQTADLEPDEAWDVAASDFFDLAAQLGC
ncbi:MAG: haloacid dehalogenase type II [Rhodospirillales bacterium]|nr:haloacid dehalogenase type II [Rhodospirillales bacterium]